MTKLLTDECRTYVYNSNMVFYWTIHHGLIQSMCDSSTFSGFVPVSTTRSVKEPVQEDPTTTTSSPIRHSSNRLPHRQYQYNAFLPGSAGSRRYLQYLQYLHDSQNNDEYLQYLSESEDSENFPELDGREKNFQRYPDFGGRREHHKKYSHQYQRNGKALPITKVMDDNGKYAHGTSDLMNTKHRYPWICSLRSMSDQKRHMCAVTLLSMPPSPTVLVSSAHCVTICRSAAMNKTLPNCCCQNVGGESCVMDTDNECETDAAIVTLTGADAEIICGEWETGTASMADSGEEYNIILPIKSVVRHPSYMIARGDANTQYVANDLAVFMVDDEQLKNSTDGIVPICLPSMSPSLMTSMDSMDTMDSMDSTDPYQSRQLMESMMTMNAIHSGWSSPPSLEFLQQNLPLYADYHKDFFKQWHHYMNITKCEDPQKNMNHMGMNGAEMFKYPTNSSYPAGTVCAVEKWMNFCPSAGDSGSPLMGEEDNKFVLHGIHSFTKGCSTFSYMGGTTSNTLKQASINPSVYTKISCYLPWIAAQYNMNYQPSGETDPDCFTSHGDMNEATAATCTTIDMDETECMFPFKVDDKEYDGCLMHGLDDMSHPIFKCPVRSIKNRNSSSLTSQDLTTHYCPSAVISANGQYELDPDLTCDDAMKLPVFATCKNTCRGGKITSI